VEGADAAVGDAAEAIADLVLDVAGGEDRLVEVLELGFFEPKLNSALAAFQLSSYLRSRAQKLSNFGA
jgi:hypothetical protein